jgi:hypothetical protein
MTTGGSVTGDVSFGDNDKANFGNSNDLKIYHDGSHSYVSDTGTGGLRLTGSSTRILDAFNNEYAKFNALGSALLHNNSQKLTTSSTGISVTGSIDVTDIATTQQNLEVDPAGTAVALAIALG